MTRWSMIYYYVHSFTVKNLSSINLINLDGLTGIKLNSKALIMMIIVYLYSPFDLLIFKVQSF
jgi:hypothetical protein